MLLGDGAHDCSSVTTLAANLLSGSHCERGRQLNWRQTNRTERNKTGTKSDKCLDREKADRQIAGVKSVRLC